MKRLSILFAGALSVSALALALASPACAAPVSATGAAAGVALAPDSAPTPASQAAVVRASGARPPAVVLVDEHGVRGGEGEEHEHFGGHGGVFIGGGWGDPWWGFGMGWGPYGDPGFYGPGYYDYGYARPSSGVKIKVTGTDPKLEEVFVNGGYAGTVDDYNGWTQELHLRPGQYRMEIRAEGFKPLDFNVMIPRGKTITYRGELQPAR